MTQANGHKQDLQAYLLAWTSMMITIWQEKLYMLQVNDTFELYNSFESAVMIHSGGDGAKIKFAFRNYGMYVNMGVGREIYVGNDGDLIDVAHYNIGRDVYELKRQAKPWFDKGFYKSMYALSRDVARIYGENIAKNIVFYLNDIKV